MRILLLCIFFLLAPVCSLAKDLSPGIDIAVSVQRYSEQPLSRRFTKLLDEATKLSAGLRTFRSLYARWPATREEVELRIAGVDFSQFKGVLSIEYSPNGAVLRLLDGQDVRELNIPAESGDFSAEVRRNAMDPSFQIRVKLVKTAT